MPAVTHQLALTMCTEAGIVETVPPTQATVVMSAGELEAATKIYVEDQAASFRKDFEAATRNVRKSKYENYSVIVRTLSFAPHGLTRSELLERIRYRYPKYPAGNLNVCLKRLIANGERGGIITKDTITQRYRFKDPQACAYAAMRFANEKWADYCIIAADYDDQGLIDKVELLRDEGDVVTDEQIWNRAQLIDVMMKGTTFVTAFDAGATWGRAKEVVLVTIEGSRFLRVDDSDVASDTLGSLPKIGELGQP